MTYSSRGCSCQHEVAAAATLMGLADSGYDMGMTLCVYTCNMPSDVFVDI